MPSLNRFDASYLQIGTQRLRLDHFLKLNGIAATGGHAKLLIQSGEVIVDGQVETRRRRKLANGNTVHVGGKDFIVTGLLPDEDRAEPA